MALRSLIGGLPAAALVVCTWTACSNGKDKDKDKGEVAKAPATAADLDERCTLMAKACGDKEKHVGKITEACKQTASQQVAKGCTEQAIAAHDCYVTKLCGTADKVWSLDDLHVLAERHGKCAAERAAVRECVEK
jgi:hypothetical protein